ncbi:MAG TPA: hypothetical protein DCL21_03590 [Alphaproteobacteria bacterium]|nr:hypothetical protein [Alphaproteobacteria bacterium]
MLKLFKFLRNQSIVAAAALVSIAPYAQAQTSEDPSTLESVRQVYDEGFTNTNVQSFEYLPEGFDKDYDYRHDEDGISIDASASYRYNLDWGNKYVNTSGGENITVLNVGAGVGGGIGLGCNGLDLGLEALFEFDAGDILEYLPQYIMTNLATEALAQIYATPLISTVMDGLKAMQNFTAEFKQASCDMNKVENRANEIKATAYKECIEEIGDGEKDGRPAEAYCSDPTGLRIAIEDKKNSFNNMAPMGESLAKVLNETMGSTGADYAEQKEYTIKDGKYVPKPGDDPEGRVPSKGRILAMFIPDIQFSASSNTEARVAPTAEITPTEANKKAYVTSNNLINDVYLDIIKSMDKNKVFKQDARNKVFAKFQKYKHLVLNMYGNRRVFTDNNSNNSNRHESTGIDAIEEAFLKASNTKFSSLRYKHGGQEVKIGPAAGPTTNIGSGDSIFTDKAKDMLELGEQCWVQVGLNNDKYKWVSVQNSPTAAFSIKARNMNELISKLSECTTAELINFEELNRKVNKDSTFDDGENLLAEAYFEYLSKEAAYQTTYTIVTALDFQSDEAVNSSNQKLLAYCQSKGLGNMEKTAARNGQKGLPYQTCKEYAKQNELTEDKINYLNSEKDKRKAELEILKRDVDQAEKRYTSIEKDIDNSKK